MIGRDFGVVLASSQLTGQRRRREWTSEGTEVAAGGVRVSGEGGEQEGRKTEMTGVDAIRLEGSAPPSQRRKTGGSTSRAKSSAAGAKSIKDALTNTLIAKMRSKFKVRETMSSCSGPRPRSHETP